MLKEMALMDAFEKTMCHDDLCLKKPQSQGSKQKKLTFSCLLLFVRPFKSLSVHASVDLSLPW